MKIFQRKKEKIKVDVGGKSEKSVTLSQSELGTTKKKSEISVTISHSEFGNALLRQEVIEVNNEEISEFIKNKIVMVTGGGGSIGSELCRQIINFEPAKLLILDNNENGAYEVQQEIQRRVARYESQVTDEELQDTSYKLQDAPPASTEASSGTTASTEASSGTTASTEASSGTTDGTDKSVPYTTQGRQIEVVIGSVQDKARMQRIYEKYSPNIIFHAAAHKHVPVLETNPFEAIKNNVFGTLNCAILADKFKVEKFILLSTDKAVNPINVMGLTKRICEHICKEMNKISDTAFTVIRFGNVIGSQGSLIPLYEKQLVEGGPLIVTHPEVTRFFMTIQNTVKLILQTGALKEEGDLFVLDMGEPIKIDDIAKEFIRLSGLELGKDIDIKYTSLRAGEKLQEELYSTEENLLTTAHEKILSVKSPDIDTEMFFEQIDRLHEIVENEDEDRFNLEFGIKN